MDAILSLGVTQLVDLLTTEKIDLSVLSLDQRRDLLLLAALYDASTGEPIERRWSRLRRRSGFRPLWSRRDLQIGFGTTLIVIALIGLFPWLRGWSVLPWLLVPVLAGWIYWGWRLLRAEWYARDIRKGLKVLSRDPSALRWELLWFKPTELGGQPLPTPARRAEERYELLRKFQGVLGTLGYGGIIVLIDRVDEPQQIEGDPRKMRALIWPLLDHKFLRHPGIGVKLLLPIELAYYLEKEDKEFYDRARPDKLNMIKPLRWTGPSLYDLASDRLRACRLTPSANGEAARAAPGADAGVEHDGPRLRSFVDESISDDSLKDALGNLPHAAAPVQVPPSPNRGALSSPYRRPAPLDRRSRHFPHHVRVVHAQSRGVRSRLRAWLRGLSNSLSHKPGNSYSRPWSEDRSRSE